MSSPRPAASSYAAVLRLPHARRTFGAALFGRLGYGVVSLSLVLSLAAATGSLPAGGLFGTEFAAVSVVLAPARAGLIDRWGARRALPALALPFASALFVLAACAHAAAGTPRWLFAVLVAAVGASCPPLGPTMRALWSAMAPDDAVLQRAFSLDTVAEELIFLAGPLLVVAIHPVPGLVLSGAVIAGGTLAMVSSPAARLIAPVPKETSAPLRLLAPEGAGVRRAAAAAFGMGVCLAAVYLYVIAAADRAHHPAAAGWILAAQSAGSALGGLLYGRVRWRLDAAARLPYLLLVMAALVAVTAAAPSLPVLGLCVAVGGLLTSPTLSTAYLAASRLAPEGTATRATTWANSAINAGSSAGGGLAALLVDRAALPVCFLLAAAAPACAALAARGRTSPRGRGREPLRAAGAGGTQQGAAGEDVPGDGGTRPRSAAGEDVPGAGGTQQGAAAEQAPGVDGNPAPTLSGT
ncbi:MFS transporter [Actinacidiphila acidipaludis]|uniref:MFS transporter n=1 Tax=Actinacidiphila acidipaludis TaxID=2873382 RepID=A0ABS7Q627_9ACTN|nr:MFS transporter [Streptomyces acidipaludis]MBY8878418.1 MFS transporter [Streptomyces acidipaludis]